jgi:hypothetical protein
MNGMVLHSLELRGFVLTLNNIRNYGKRDRTRLPAYKMVQSSSHIVTSHIITPYKKPLYNHTPWLD